MELRLLSNDGNNNHKLLHFVENISNVTRSTMELRLRSNDGKNNHKLLHFVENISKVTRTTMELRLLSSEGINNHKLLHFLLLTASFHLYSRIITFSALKIS
jgi:uncharacterized protein YggU (UPF0235/DUF167 family)